MANPMKIAKLISKQVKKRDAVRTAVRKKSYSAAPAKAKFLTPTTGKVKAIKRAKEFDISVGLAGSKKNGRLAFSEYNYFGNKVVAKGGKNSKKFAKLNKATMIDTGLDLGVSPGRAPAAKSRKVSNKTLQKSKATMVPRTRSIPYKSTSKIPVKRRGR